MAKHPLRHINSYMVVYIFLFLCPQNLGALSANMDNYNYIVPAVVDLCREQEQEYCNPPVLSFDNNITVQLSFSLLRTLVRLFILSLC